MALAKSNLDVALGCDNCKNSDKNGSGIKSSISSNDNQKENTRNKVSEMCENCKEDLPPKIGENAAKVDAVPLKNKRRKLNDAFDDYVKKLDYNILCLNFMKLQNFIDNDEIKFMYLPFFYNVKAYEEFFKMIIDDMELLESQSLDDYKYRNVCDNILQLMLLKKADFKLAHAYKYVENVKNIILTVEKKYFGAPDGTPVSSTPNSETDLSLSPAASISTGSQSSSPSDQVSIGFKTHCLRVTLAFIQNKAKSKIFPELNDEQIQYLNSLIQSEDVTDSDPVIQDLCSTLREELKLFYNNYDLKMQTIESGNEKKYLLMEKTEKPEPPATTVISQPSDSNISTNMNPPQPQASNNRAQICASQLIKVRKSNTLATAEFAKKALIEILKFMDSDKPMIVFSPNDGNEYWFYRQCIKWAKPDPRVQWTEETCKLFRQLKDMLTTYKVYAATKKIKKKKKGGFVDPYLKFHQRRNKIKLKDLLNSINGVPEVPEIPASVLKKRLRNTKRQRARVAKKKLDRQKEIEALESRNIIVSEDSDSDAESSSRASSVDKTPAREKPRKVNEKITWRGLELERVGLGHKKRDVAKQQSAQKKTPFPKSTQDWINNDEQTDTQPSDSDVIVEKTKQLLQENISFDEMLKKNKNDSKTSVIRKITRTGIINKPDSSSKSPENKPESSKTPVIETQNLKPLENEEQVPKRSRHFIPPQNQSSSSTTLQNQSETIIPLQNDPQNLSSPENQPSKTFQNQCKTSTPPQNELQTATTPENEPQTSNTPSKELETAKTPENEAQTAKTPENEPQTSKTLESEPQTPKTPENEPQTANTSQNEPETSTTPENEPQITTTPVNEPQTVTTPENEPQTSKENLQNSPTKKVIPYKSSLQTQTTEDENEDNSPTNETQLTSRTVLMSPRNIRSDFLQAMLDIFTKNLKTKTLQYFKSFIHKEQKFVRIALEYLNLHNTKFFLPEEVDVVKKILKEYRKRPNFVVKGVMSDSNKELSLRPIPLKLLPIKSLTTEEKINTYVHTALPIFATQKAFYLLKLKISILLSLLDFLKTETEELEIEFTKVLNKNQRVFIETTVDNINLRIKGGGPPAVVKIFTAIFNHLQDDNVQIGVMFDHSYISLTFSKYYHNLSPISNKPKEKAQTIIALDSTSDSSSSPPYRKLGRPIITEADITDDDVSSLNEDLPKLATPHGTQLVNLKEFAKMYNKTNEKENTSVADKIMKEETDFGSEKGNFDLSARNSVERRNCVSEISDTSVEYVVCVGYQEEIVAGGNENALKIAQSEKNGNETATDETNNDNSETVDSVVDNETVNNNSSIISKDETNLDVVFTREPIDGGVQQNGIVETDCDTPKLNLDLRKDICDTERSFVKSGIKIAHILHVNDPIQKIDVEKAKEIQKVISENIMKGEQLPLLKCHGYQNDSLIYSCQNQEAFEWLNRIIESIGDLKIFTKVHTKMLLKLRSLYDITSEHLFIMLEKYNTGLSTVSWEVESKSIEDSVIVFVVKMDEASIDFICESNMALYAGVDKVDFSLV
ncbi:hypothetical protein SFRURICE_019232 [Spodoptera frugiperda]|nr:hypothetical protein SFRURICE_019232 [Spodoptera frugiperda]